MSETTQTRPALADGAKLALRVLEDHREDGLGFTEWLGATGAARTTHRRSIEALAGAGLIEKRDDQRYYPLSVVEGPSSRGPDQDAGDEEPEQRAEVGIEAAQEEADRARAAHDEARELLDQIDREIVAAVVAQEEAEQRAEDLFAATGSMDSDTGDLDEAEKRLKDLRRRRRWQERVEVEASIESDQPRERLLEAQLRESVAERERLENKALAARDAAIQAGNGAASLESERATIRQSLTLKRDYLTALKNPQAEAPDGFRVRRTPDGGFYRA